MKFSHKLGLSVSAMTMAVSAAAMADVTAGTYLATGFITASTCSKFDPALGAGSPSNASVFYAGAGKPMSVISPSTTSAGAAGSANTTVCVSGAVPSKGLNGATLTFTCYDDTVKGKAAKPLIQFSTKFAIGASHVAGVYQASSTVTISALSCAYTQDQSIVLQ